MELTGRSKEAPRQKITLNKHGEEEALGKERKKPWQWELSPLKLLDSDCKEKRQQGDETHNNL